MKRLAAGLALVLVACPGPLPPPEVQKRDAPVAGTPRRDGGPPDITGIDDADAGPFSFDAGPCCLVKFALDAQPDEVESQLRFVTAPGSWPMTREGGAWSVVACIQPVETRYYFSVGLSAESDAPDGGLFVMTRINQRVASEVGTVAEEVNVFSPVGVTTCAELDAGVYASVVDGGR